jgi:tetratricopeptide (TPR) repeat protein
MRTEFACGKLILVFVLCLNPQCPGQSRRDSVDAGALLTSIRALFASGEWEDVVRLSAALPDAPAELDYYRGLALARLDRWQEARAAFKSGRRKAPHDGRFPLELAGVMFKVGNHREAEAQLRQALHLDPADSYGNDFMASLYYLDGNLGAAIKYWNRIGKPQIRQVTTDPALRTDPVLLDRATAFSSDDLLTLKEYYSSRTMLDSLGIFSSPHFDLSPRNDGSFDMGFRALERNGWGETWLDGLVSLLRGAPCQTLHPEFFNLRGAAWNSISLFRWDAQKRRLFTSMSGPIGGNPRMRLLFRLDARRENWNIASSLRNPAPGQNLFSMNTREAGAEFQTILGSRTRMHNTVILSYRRFEKNPGGNSAWQSLFRKGTGLTYEMGVSQSWSAPERRLDLTWDAESRLGKILASPDSRFVRFTGTLQWSWLPQAGSHDYRLSGRISAGLTVGDVPFDQLFSLGMERDNDLYARGHNGTQDGKKGTGPLGRSYVLASWQLDKSVHESGFWKLSLGPFFDTGKTYDKAAFFGSDWIWDTGVESKLTILGRFTFSVSYGRNLRGGKTALFSRILH